MTRIRELRQMVATIDKRMATATPVELAELRVMRAEAQAELDKEEMPTKQVASLAEAVMAKALSGDYGIEGARAAGTVAAAEMDRAAGLTEAESLLVSTWLRHAGAAGLGWTRASTIEYLRKKGRIGNGNQ